MPMSKFSCRMVWSALNQTCSEMSMVLSLFCKNCKFQLDSYTFYVAIQKYYTFLSPGIFFCLNFIYLIVIYIFFCICTGHKRYGNHCVNSAIAWIFFTALLQSPGNFARKQLQIGNFCWKFEEQRQEWGRNSITGIIHKTELWDRRVHCTFT